MAHRFDATRSARWFAMAGGLIAALLLNVAPAAETSSPAPAAPAARTAEAQPAWAALTPAQQAALKPLAGSWSGIDSTRKQKWLEVASHFGALPQADRERAQERMAAWAALSPTERARARIHFQETRSITADERKERWDAYQALPEEEKRRLTQIAKRKAKAHAAGLAASTAAPLPGSAAAAPKPTGSTAAIGAPGTSGNANDVPKRNMVTVSPAQSVRSVAPALVQAKPGVTTNSVAKRASPPAHNQPGLPKIVSTPAFVDPTTLLPRRGPQGAAALSAAASTPSSGP